MDDTQQSRVSDAAAAANRKRRSSILKSQRPARTPFSELEFNVATPTDTAKSRRVSFSKRTGVAEFVTNEATTTWKNFYEEHNKSLESSSNESEANASRQPVGHLGKRIFDQQFQEVEAVDFMSGLTNGSLNVNFSQQPISLECTEGKLTAPNNKFELSAFTEQSKLFGNDFTAPTLGEGSGRIDVNFSAIQQIEKDDLDEFEKDLQRGPNNMGCLGPFSDRQNMCEYIEVDLNMTHVAKNDEDMSITDTVHSPVQDVSKSASIDKKAILNSDWVADKENIVVNPYAAPVETNFAVNEEPDQVLVFDGKRLTLQPDVPDKEKNYRQTLLPNSSAETPTRKTIVLNTNDDLPNYLGDMRNSKCENSFYNGFQEIKSNEDEISDTLQLSRAFNKPKRQTIHDITGNISITSALPTNIICQTAVISQDGNPNKRKSIVFEKSANDISMTEPVPVKLLSSGGSLAERCHTVVYEDDTANISMTQAVPSNILVNETPEDPKKEIFESDDALSSNTLLEQKSSTRKTIVFDDDNTCNVSFTQAVPSNILLADKLSKEKRQTIIYENDTGNISVTQALPTNVILANNEPNSARRQTIVYSDDTGNISVTQALPSNILLEKHKLDVDYEAESIPTSQPLLNTTAKNSDAVRRRTIVYENDTGNLSITQAIPAQLIPGYSQDKPIDTLNTSSETSPTHANTGKKPRNRQRQTIAYDNDDGDISMTEAISAKIIEEVKAEGKTIVFDENEANISATLAVSTNVFLLDQLDTDVDRGETKEKVTDYDVYDERRNSPVEVVQDERKSNVFYPDTNFDMSLTTAISKVASLRETEKGDMSITKPIPAQLMTVDTELSSKVKDKLLDLTEPGQVVSRQSDVIVLQSSRASSRPKLQMSISEEAELRKIGAIYNDMLKDPSDMTAIESFVADVAPLRKRDVSANASVVHSRLEEKTNRLSLVSTDWKLDQLSDGEDDAVMQTDVEEKPESLVNSEASMSVTTIGSGTDDKNVMVCMASSHSPSVKTFTDGNTSPESLFYITKDMDDAATDVEAKLDKSQNVSCKQLPIHHLDEHLEAVDELQKKLALLESNGLQNRSQRYFDEVTSVDSKQVDEVDEDDTVEQQSNSYKSANDTQELLNMLTNLTDNLDSDIDIAPVVKAKDSEVTEHRRLSFRPSRQSIALSREDLLNNISMAQAALQKSRLELDDIDSFQDDTKDATVDIADKSGRASSDVVKTLHFHDDSTVSEDSLAELTPLKKTAFGETSYMYEPKGKVIPTYLKDVSDGIKELMLDLVKPVANENLPFETGTDKDLPATSSTQSTQIQANLIGSSQVDIGSEVYSRPESNSNLPHMSQSPRPVTFSENMSEFDDSDNKENWVRTHKPEEQPPVAPVLIFDHTNPLNNVLLPPMDFTEPHRYNPIVRPVQNANLPFDIGKDEGLDTKIKLVKTEETLQDSEGLQTSPPPNTQSIGIHYNYTNREEVSRDFEVQTLTTTKEKEKKKRTSILQNGPNKLTPPKQESNAKKESKVSPHTSPKPTAQRSTPSVLTKLLSLDQSVDAVVRRSKDDEVNTTIAMQQNRVLLATSSSLTLVDDAVEGQTSPTLPGKESTSQRIRFSRLQLVDIAEQAMEADNTPKLTEIFSPDHYSSDSNAHMSKGKKRFYSPFHKHKHQSNEEVTPKPLTKMQKISDSPKVQSKMPAELSSTDDSGHSMEPESDDNIHSAKSHDKISPKSKTKKPGHTVVVRQLISDCISFDPSCQRTDEDKNLPSYLNPKTDNLAELSHSDVSFTSSKDMKSASDEMMDCQSPHQSTREALPRQADWQPDLMADTSSSKCESDTSVNVVAKIDMLSFMGGHECRWESSTADTWSFLLLHGRLRLTACLAPRPDSAQPQQRGDTLVRDLTVEVVQLDHKNPVAAMCVKFACETMRHVTARALRGDVRARDVAPLLRRCAAVARIALRWGRAMHDAKLHLAYSIDSDGNLAMKVANVPLRAVWEVRLRVALALDDARAVPAPRAADVRVRAVVSGVNVDADVARALAHTPKDWGHAPRIIWKVFRLLKHKKRDDYLLA